MQQTLRFDGPDLEESDNKRLSTQLYLVRRLMLDGQWRTHRQIAEAIGQPHALNGVSARLRDLRKNKPLCGFQVERRRTDVAGVFEYRVSDRVN